MALVPFDVTVRRSGRMFIAESRVQGNPISVQGESPNAAITRATAKMQAFYTTQHEALDEQVQMRVVMVETYDLPS